MYLHVPFCCFVLCCLQRFFPFSVSLNFPTFPAPTFSPFSLFGFQHPFFLGHFSCSHIFPIFALWSSKCLLFLHCHVSDCERWFFNDFSIVYSLFVFAFGGGGDLGIVSPKFL